jgi:SAM-dependent methyltransferase
VATPPPPTEQDLGLLFDTVAEDYDAVRPHYPAALFDDLETLTGLRPRSRLLEIGCGPGIATRDLLRRGWVVDAVEPGAAMARVALRAAAGAPLRVEVSTFEQWTPPPEPYEVVFSATAIHWVDPDLRWAKTASVLEPGGHLALATNRTLSGGTFDELYGASAALHRQYAPDMSDEGRSPDLDAFRSELEAAASDIGTLWGVADPKGGAAPAGRDHYEPPVLCSYPWEQPYSRREAIRLLGTYSPYLVLPEERRTALLAGIGELIDARFGGTVIRRYLSILAVARRAGV